MHEEYISQSDMGDFILIDDDDEVIEDQEEDYPHEHHLTKEEEENAMEVDDDEWETEDSEWETEDECDMISVEEENDGPIITEITSDNELEGEDSNKKMDDEKIKEEIKASLLNVKSDNKNSSELKSFILLEDPPENHHFIDNENTVLNKSFYKTIMKEHKLLSTELPEGEIVVAAFSSRLELLRAIIFGPKDTIYEGNN